MAHFREPSSGTHNHLVTTLIVCIDLLLCSGTLSELIALHQLCSGVFVTPTRFRKVLTYITTAVQQQKYCWQQNQQKTRFLRTNNPFPEFRIHQTEESRIASAGLLHF